MMRLLFVIIALCIFSVPELASCQTKFHCGQRTVNIPHRGASGHAPEHTLLAYQLGLNMAGDYIEIDLHMTKDGELIAFHDDTLDRTTNGSGAVNKFTLREIQKLDAGSWFNEHNPQNSSLLYHGLKIPTLQEVISHFGNEANYYIEIKSHKSANIEEKLIKILEKNNLLNNNEFSHNITIQSFYQDSLKKIHKSRPNIPLFTLLPPGNNLTEEAIKEIKSYATGIGISFEQLTESTLQTLRSHGLEVHVFTVNQKDSMRKLVDWGVNGIFTDYPDLLNEVLLEHQVHFRECD